jgi:hypothetical protein
MEIKRFGSRNEIVFSPTFSGSIAAAGKKPMQHGEINGPLNVKVVAASCEQRLNYLLNPAFFPEPPKDQVRPDPLHPHGFGLPCGMRIDDGEVLAMTQARTYQRLEASAGLEFIEPAQSPEDLLAHLLTLAHTMDDLEILIGTGTFDSEKHCSLLSATMESHGFTI